MVGRPAGTASLLFTHKIHTYAREIMLNRTGIKILMTGWIITFLGTFIQAQSAWSFPDFTAIQVFHSGKADITMKVYRSGSRVRVERSGALSTLYVPTSAKVYNLTVYPDKSRQCVSMKPEQAKMLPSPLELIQGKILKRTVLGVETIEGHNSRVETVVVLRPDGKKIQSKIWEAKDLKGVPVKIQSKVDTVTLTAIYRDIKLGAPETALFAVPDRCTPFEKMWQVAEAKLMK